MPANKTKRSNDDSPERRSKRRRLNEDDEEEDKERENVAKAEPVSKGSKASSKKSSVYGGGSGSQKPAELFRKDLISAMKLPDSEPLNPDDYLLIADTWRQEWERGVQVPVGEVGLKTVDMKAVCEKPSNTGDFKIPKKFLHGVKDETYQLGLHELTGMSMLAEQVVRYDLDDLDVTWLRQLNEHREECGDPEIHEWTMERVIEALEGQCHENMENKKKTEEGLGIEYDEDIVCEICQSPDSEDTNEMVFCDGCDICVHQACYGIQTVPEGSWLCRTCALGIKPACILCPKIGGAMKSTRSGTKWAHVSCAIWIPEVTIGCVEKMEPVTKISQIPASRWALVCCVCKERNGACIQCSVKACKTAFHVTCAIADKLEMKTVLVEEKNTEDVKLKAYCPKHSKNRERHGSESDPDSPRKSPISPHKEQKMSEEEMATLRAERLQKLEETFYQLVSVPDIASKLELTTDVVDLIYVFWKLKRRSLFNRPLLTPKTEEADLLEKQQEDSLVARMKMFVHLRQDLERVRNLSYMISRREKMKRQFNSARESVFYAALDVLTDKKLNLSTREVDKIVRTYKDLPFPYGSQKKGSSVSRAGSISSRHSSVDLELPESESSKVDQITRRLSMDVNNSNSTQKKNEMKSDNISETPRLRKPGPRCKQIAKGFKMDSDGEDAFNTSDAGLDDTLKDTSQDSVDDKTLVQSETEMVEKETTKSNVKPKVEGKRGVGRPRKIRHETDSVKDKEFDSIKVDIKKEKSDEKTDVQKVDRKSESKTDTKKEAKDDSKKDTETNKKEADVKRPLAKKTRTRSSLPDIVNVGDETIVKMEVDDDYEADSVKEVKAKVTDRKDRRMSAAVKLTDKEKLELVEKFPSANNVSDHTKSELSTYFRNNKLLVNNKLRQKVQTALLNGKRRSRLGNGIIIDHNQRKIDNYFVKSPPHSTEALKSPAKSVSRVLNELSPTRDRLEANNIERTTKLRSGLKVSESQRSDNTPHRQSPSLSEKSYDGRSVDSPGTRSKRVSADVSSVRERLFDDDYRRVTRSRESTPESTTSSVISANSHRRSRYENTRAQTRSMTPTSAGKESDESETENIFNNEGRRLRR